MIDGSSTTRAARAPSATATLSRALIAFESEESARLRLAAFGYPPDVAAEIAVYLAQSTDLPLFIDDIAQAPSVTRELALIKVAASPRNRAQIFDLVEVFRARIVDLTSESLMIEMTGVESKIEGLIEVLREDDGRILEVCRSGKMTMRRGHHVSSVVRAMGVNDAEAGETQIESGKPN